jgi:hypothetical protein
MLRPRLIEIVNARSDPRDRSLETADQRECETNLLQEISSMAASHLRPIAARYAHVRSGIASDEHLAPGGDHWTGGSIVLWRPLLLPQIAVQHTPGVDGKAHDLAVVVEGERRRRRGLGTSAAPGGSTRVKSRGSRRKPW